MIRLRIASLVILFVALSGLGWFLASKPIQLTREYQLSAGVALYDQVKADAIRSHGTQSPPTIPMSWTHLAPKTMNDAIVAGLVRRLDDVSFWNTITAIIASFLMFRAWLRAERHPAASAEPFPVARSLAIGGAVACLLSGFYVLAVYVNPGTFFYGRRNPDLTDATLKTLQFVEGAVNIAVICAASFLLPLGLHLVKVIGIGLGAANSTDPPNECEELRKSSAALAGVIIAPLASTLLAFAGWKVIRTFAPINPSVLGSGGKWWAVVLFCTVLCLQFGVLGWKAHKTLGHLVKPKIDVVKTLWIAVLGALTSVGSLVLYLAVDATWREKSPCSKK